MVAKGEKTQFVVMTDVGQNGYLMSTSLENSKKLSELNAAGREAIDVTAKQLEINDKVETLNKVAHEDKIS